MLVSFALWLVSAGYGLAETVRHVIDGDTLVLRNNQRVRLIGVDAPEVENKKYNRRAEPFGKESKRFLKALVQGKEVRLEDGLESFDKYGRRLAYVYLRDGTFVNKRLIKDGYAETYRKFPFEYKQDFLEAEEFAKSQKLGMWDRRQSWWEKLFHNK